MYDAIFLPSASASASIAPFTACYPAVTPATHAITRLACPPEVKSRSGGKFNCARLRHFPHVVPRTFLAISPFSRRDVIRHGYTLFSRWMRMNVHTLRKKFTSRIKECYLLNRSRYPLLSSKCCVSLLLKALRFRDENCVGPASTRAH